MSRTYGGRRTRLQWATSLALLMAAGLALAQGRPAAAGPRTLLVMGDSLSAGYGMAAAQSWVALAGERLATRTPPWRAVNASISGETSAGGAARIVDEVVRHRPRVVVIALGANDGLRGLPLAQLQRNLARMIGASQGVGARVLVVGMRLPHNYGAAYTGEFERGFCALAVRFDAACLPFLLEPIARDDAAFQADNMHPVAAVQPRLRDHVWKALVPLLD